MMHFFNNDPYIRETASSEDESTYFELKLKATLKISFLPYFY